MAKPKTTKKHTTLGTAQWFWLRMERAQSNSILRFLADGGTIPSGVNAEDVLKTCLRDCGSDGRPRVTDTDEKKLLTMLGKGKLPDEGIRGVLVYGSAYGLMSLNKKRPDLMPAESVGQHLRTEALQLIDMHFIQRRRNDKRLRAFINWVEKIPGFTEIVAVHHVHGL